jgi:hypothetical protein
MNSDRLPACLPADCNIDFWQNSTGLTSAISQPAKAETIMFGRRKLPDDLVTGSVMHKGAPYYARIVNDEHRGGAHNRLSLEEEQECASFFRSPLRS